MGIFREKSMERISSPEDLDSYLRVANPPVWFGLAAAVLILLGTIVWGIFGRMNSTVDTVCVSKDGVALCYVREGDFAAVEAGDEAVIDGVSYHVGERSGEGLRAETVLNDYAMHLCALEEGEYVHVLSLSDASLPDGCYAGSIITETVSAISFLWN